MKFEVSMPLNAIARRNTTCTVHVRGVDLLHNPALNKGTAFDEAERDTFCLHGPSPAHRGVA